MTWLWVALAGGAGAALRHLAHVLFASRGHSTARATLAVNVVGSLAAGALACLIGRWLLPADLGVVLGVGLLGGFTTFSTASVEVVRLGEAGRRAQAGTLASVMLVASVGAAALGWWLACLV